MRLYLVTKNDSEDFRLWLFFFLRSALACAARLTEVDAWKDESRPSPWRREEVGRNTVWRLPSGVAVELIPIRLAFRDWSLGRWFRSRCHWQNLNEKGRGVRGSILREGRAWFRPFGYKRDLSLNAEWRLWSKRVSCGLGLADYDHALQFHVCLYAFSLYLTLEHNRLEYWLREKTKRKDDKYGNGRIIGFHLTEGTFFFDLWNDPMDWRSKDPKWWHFSFNPKRFITGGTNYKDEVIETHPALVTMPEGHYPATVTIHRSAWTPRRWPFSLFPKIRVDSRIEVKGGIPVPGKGENSYDCDDDAIISTGSSTPTVAAAVAQITKSVLETRERYGGRNWLPEKCAAA